MNRFIFLTSIGLICASSVVNAATDSVAMLPGLTGNITTNGKPLSLFSELKADTQVTLTEKTQATLILLNSGQEFVICRSFKCTN